MTTTAPPVAGLEIANTDAMELLSDTGYDLGDRDGDIDFDLEPTNGDEHQEDDVLSLQDAGMDGGIDLQTASGDPDDFMVDKEDLIEEDEIDYGDLELTDAGQPSINGPVDLQDAIDEHRGLADAIADSVPNANNEEIPEEDLIDYSDEEDQLAEETQIAGSNGSDAQKDEAPTAGDDDEKSLVEEASGTLDLSAQENQDHVFEYQSEQTQGGNDNTEQPWNGAADPDWEQIAHRQHEESTHADGEPHDEDQQQEESKQNIADEVQQLTQANEAERENLESKTESRTFRNSGTDEPLHPVTINYDGSELWLFKPRDTEDGEWLLSDESVATQQFPYLLHACRAQLGDDIDSETELGFRFDNFHALELFEECTACAHTSLKELVDIYLELHSQDGQTNPEPFYITLQFRPRVLTLVNELKKAVRDQVGFSGLNSAIAAGQTSFNNTLLTTHAESSDEQWDNEEQEPEELAQPEQDAKADDKTVPEEQHSDSVHVDSSADFINAAAAYRAENDAHNAHTPTVEENVEQGPTEANDGNVPASGSHDEQELEEDLIDYSDDDGATNAAETGETSVNEPSSGSSTVQGDDALHPYDDAETVTNPAETRKFDRQSDKGHEDEQVPIEPTGEDAYAGYEDDAEADNAGYQDDQAFDQAFEEGFNQDNSAEGFDLEEYSGQDLNFYDNDDGTTLDQQDNFGLTRAVDDADGFHSQGPNEQTIAEGGFAGVEDFLDLTGATGNTVTEETSALLDSGIEDEINYDDDEGAPEPASVDALSSVPAGVASSAGLDDQGSPQGQKRPIAEVDISLDGTNDAADSKRLKL